ncbi:hypothetical protein HDV05_006334 [Chytridiales sp. JEL 0842]|nr:hypothetical protein HDV05_006334 [Chytridiales sp. JEL 0842]
MSAASAGELMACFIRVPTEVVKQRMQAGQYKSVVEAVSSIYARDGFKGFYRGYAMTVFREIMLSSPSWLLHYFAGDEGAYGTGLRGGKRGGGNGIGRRGEDDSPFRLCCELDRFSVDRVGELSVSFDKLSIDLVGEVLSGGIGTARRGEEGPPFRLCCEPDQAFNDFDCDSPSEGAKELMDVAGVT